jgi:hypothetical protein
MHRKRSEAAAVRRQQLARDPHTNGSDLSLPQCCFENQTNCQEAMP